MEERTISYIYSLKNREEITKQIINLIESENNIRDNLKIIENLEAGQLIIFNETRDTIMSIMFKDLSHTSFESKDGEAFMSCIPIFKNEMTKQFYCDPHKSKIMAIKLIPLNDSEFAETSEPLSKRKGKVWNEIRILEKCKEEYTTNPNLPIMYYYGHSDKIAKQIYRNSHAPTRQNNPGLILFNEFANETLNSFIHQIHNALNMDILDNIMFQILVGLYTLHNKFHVIHYDLHLSNVLIIDTLFNEFNEVYEYKINNKTYYLDNIGILSYPWDFGRSYFSTDSTETHVNNFIKISKKVFGKEKTIINHNRIVNYIKKKGIEPLYSYDIYKIFFSVYNILKNNNILLNEIEVYKEIYQECRNDLEQVLLNKKKKINGTAGNILEKYFSHFKNKPEGSNTIQSFDITNKNHK